MAGSYEHKTGGRGCDVFSTYCSHGICDPYAGDNGIDPSGEIPVKGVNDSADKIGFSDYLRFLSFSHNIHILIVHSAEKRTSQKLVEYDMEQ